MTDVVAADRPEPVNARVRSLALARTLSVGAAAGAICGLLVGGVLGRLAMRLLAVTSGQAAQGGVTDDQAIVGEVTLRGTVTLALICTGLGALGGLIYLWVRRVLPDSLRGRVLGYGLFSGAVGGALFVHEHGSFDYTVLAPAWLAVAMFVALPLLFGLTVPALVDVADREGGLGRSVPLVVLVVLALSVVWPSLILTAVFIGVAFAVVMVPSARRAWNSLAVTVAGKVLYTILVLWGVYGLIADCVSIATDQHPTCRSTPSKQGCCVSSCQAGLWPTSIYSLRASPVLDGCQ